MSDELAGPRRLSAETGLPLIEIGTRARLSLRDVWAGREMFLTLVWRLIGVRYKETVVGVGWAVIQPLVLMVIFVVFLGMITRVASDGMPYPLFFYTGLFCWGAISQSLTQGCVAITGNSHLLTKVYFPRLFLPASIVAATFFDLLMSIPVLVALHFWYGAPLTVGLLWMPVAFIIAFALSLGLALWASALNVFYRDVGYVVPFAVQMWMFLSPIIYPTSAVPARFQAFYALNPVVAVIDITRWAFAGGPPVSARILAASLVATIAVLVSGFWFFERRQADFVDIV